MDGHETRVDDDQAPPTYLTGALMGAAAGVLMAACDFLATFGLVLTVGERVDLAVRLVAVAAPVGAVVGGIAMAAHALGARALARRALRRGGDAAVVARRLAPFPLTVALAAPMAAVAWLLFSGPSASQMALRPLFIAGAFAAMVAGTWGALTGGAKARRWAATSRRRAVVGAVCLTTAWAISRADQVLYPALYDYLHASMSVLAFGMLFLFVDLAMWRAPRARPALLVIGALSVGFVVNLSTLGMSETVRPVLLDPRGSHVRSSMLALAPLLAPADRAQEDAIARAESARARRRAALAVSDLPTWEGAHVLLITIDALRPDHLGIEGYERPTSPNLDRFARDAIVFDRAYAQAPHSSYSLSSLMTSEYLHEAIDAGASLPDATLASALSGAGYRTSALFPLGIFHTEGERLTAYSESRFHFDRTEVGDLDAEAKTDAAIDELKEIAAAGEPRSFTWVHYFDVHEPYQDTRFGREDIDRYDSEIAHVDAEVGRLLSATEEHLSGEVIVVVSADHGEEFRDHGGVYHGFTLYEEQIRVPLLIRAPGLSPARIGEPVELVDLAPTLLSMVGVASPESMRGDDLRALVCGHVQSVGPAFAGVGPRKMVVAHTHKLVANLRFGVFELYDLSTDPRERDNLAGRDTARLDELRAEIFAWIDSLSTPPGDADASDPRALAIRRGRLGDQRAVEPLTAIVRDADDDPMVVAESARILGTLGAYRAKGTLARALSSESREVRAEAAIALGRLYDARATEPLAAIVSESEQPIRRARAAIALARLSDARALPHLPDAALHAPSRRERNEAIHFLGELGSGDQLEPLLALLADFRTRRPAALALGRLGDARALPVLLGVLDHEEHANIRDAVVVALGRLGDPAAVPRLTSLFAEEPDLRAAAEALIRLGALRMGLVGGVDLSPTAEGLVGFDRCEAGELDHPYRFVSRTHCTADGVTSAASLVVPEAVSTTANGADLVVRMASADDSETVVVRLFIGDEKIAEVEVDGEWMEHRVVLAPTRLTSELVLRFEATKPVRVDHALLVPRSTILARSSPPT